jgi:pyruvate/2-oxoglutarate dehydrogenase complex dihydrolipoamide acyltransferase (E2) component
MSIKLSPGDRVSVEGVIARLEEGGEVALVLDGDPAAAVRVAVKYLTLLEKAPVRRPAPDPATDLPD